ncbi:MAG: glycosyltransferase [Campylobacterales bacterium]|nr:glycosyltransferase [Campylobacterales bacterium]
MSKKKVAILIYSLGSGGAERVVSILLNELKDVFDIHLVLMNDTIDYDIPKDTKIYYLERSIPEEKGILKLSKLFFLALKYANFCKKHNIKTTLSFMNRPNYINILSKFFGNRSKTVINERAMPSLQYGYNNVQSRINQRLIRWLYPLSDFILSNSIGNSLDLKENFGIDKEIKTIYNPIDIQKTIYLSKLDVDFDFSLFTFITVGRLDEGKNHKLLIDAFKNLQDINTQLVIIGDGLLRDFLSEYIIQENLQNRVFLVGQQKNPYAWLEKSNCFLFGSNHEGFPNVLLEALSCKLPIISTDCKSGPREILCLSDDLNQTLDKIEFCEYGILVPIKNVEFMSEAMKIVLNDFSIRQTYIEKAQNGVKRFEKSSIVKEFELILRD